MFRSKKSVLLVQLALVSAFCGNAYAASLGELRVNSGLGQPLVAKVRINAQADESVTKGCFDVVLHDGDSSGPTRRTVLDYQEDKGGGGWLVISSEASLGEPIGTMNLRLHCNDSVDLRREYTFFLDPPVVAPRIIGETAAKTLPSPSGRAGAAPQALATVTQANGATTGNASAASSDYVAVGGESLNSLAQQRFPGSADARRVFIAAARALNPALPANGDAPLTAGTRVPTTPALAAAAHPLTAANGEWTVHNGESFFAIVRKMYPDQPARKQALVALMRQLNPSLPRDGEAPLPAGTHLKLPLRLDRLPAGTGHAAQAAVGKPTAAAGVPAALGSNVPATGAGANTAKAAKPAEIEGARLVVSNGAATAKTTDTAIQQMAQHEAELNDQLSDQMAKLNETNYRIDKLEKRMTSLLAELARRDQEARAAQAKQAQIRDRNQWVGIGIGALGGAGLVLVIVLILHRISRRRDESSSQDLLAPAPLPEQEDSLLWQDIQPTPSVRSAPVEPMDRPVSRPSSSDMDVYVLNSVASEAAVLAAHGQHEHAVALLQSEIDRHPTQIVNWMQLLELLYGHRDIPHFLSCAAAFRERFASEALWEKVSRMGRELVPANPLFSAVPSTMGVAPAAFAADNVDITTELKRVLDGLDEGSPPIKAPASEVNLDFDLDLDGMQAAAPPAATPAFTPEAAVMPPLSKTHAVEPNFDLGDSLSAPTEPAFPSLHTQATPASAPSSLTPSSQASAEKLAALDDDALMFDLDLDAPALPADFHVEMTIPQAPMPASEIDLTGIKEGSTEHAQRLIDGGRREEGAALLEHIMLIGNLEERLAAAELLVRLTSPL